MTRVLIRRDTSGAYHSFKVVGHSGFDRAGRDIVCSAVSILCTTCANALETVAGIRPRVRQEEGYLFVAIDRNNEKAQTIFQVFRQGISDLQEAYPKHIRLTERESA